MASIQEQLDSFNRFVADQIEDQAMEYTLDQLYDQWRIENPTDAEYAENVAAVQSSIDDFKRGERGRPTKEVSDEIRDRLGLGGDGVSS